MTTRIYVAAASAEIDRAERVIAALRESPHIEIAEDWCARMRANPPDGELSREALAEACRANERGVASADFVLVLAGPQMSQGRAGELALATREGATCTAVCSGSWRDLGIFGALIEPEWTFYSRELGESDVAKARRIRRDDDRAIHFLRGIALGRVSIEDADDVRVCPGCHAAADASREDERCLDCLREPCSCEQDEAGDLEDKIDAALEAT